MTGMLKAMFDERAERLDLERPDVERIIATGRGRRRRRRAGTALVVLGLLAGGPALWGALRSGEDALAIADGSASGPVWSQGSRVHLGNETVDVGRQVHAFVRTEAGLVLSDPDQAVWSWQEGHAAELGRMRDDWRQRMTGDDRYVAWLDVSDGRWQFAIFDAATGDVRRVPAQVPAEARTEDPDPHSRAAYLRDHINVYAVDAGMLYAIDGRGVLAIGLADGSVDVVAPPGDQLVVDDVQDGRLLFSERDAAGRDPVTYLEADVDDRDRVVGIDGGDLSPGLRWVMSENSDTTADRFTLVDLEAGTVREMNASKDYDFFTGYAWIDDDIFAAYGLRLGDGGAPTGSLLTCDAVGGTCEETKSGLSWKGDVQLPTGEHLSG